VIAYCLIELPSGNCAKRSSTGAIRQAISRQGIDKDLALEHNRIEQAIVLDVSGESFELAGRHQRDQGEERVDGMNVEWSEVHETDDAYMAMRANRS
jgi:hypothetical protein